MIVLSVGMPRAGSGWHYNLIHDLMKAMGSAEAADIRIRFRLQDILSEVNCKLCVVCTQVGCGRGAGPPGQHICDQGPFPTHGSLSGPSLRRLDSRNVHLP
jgi:hypothetical protein